MLNGSKSMFEWDLYKLMNNAVSIKTLIENVDKRREMKLMTRRKNIRKTTGVGSLIAKRNLNACTIFSEDLIVIHIVNVKVRYFKPIYFRSNILES